MIPPSDDITPDAVPGEPADARNGAEVLLGVARRAGCVAIDVAKEATYTAIGLGILGFQSAQVRRRELERALRR